MASLRGQDVVVLAVVVLAVVVLAVATTDNIPSVTYITSKTFGDFFMAYGKCLTIQDAYANISVTSHCECRMACWSAPWCMAAATLPSKYDLTCLLAKKGPLDSTLQDLPGAIYTFWKASVPGQYYEAMPDGLLYVELKGLMTFSVAYTTCARLPGHRLGIYKTGAQTKALLLLYNKNASRGMLVSLRKTLDGTDRRWDDGTLFSASAVLPLTDLGTVLTYPVYTFYGNRFKDLTLLNVDRVVCQANPQGIVW